MQIAVASQNRKQVTGHTGRCRKFWVYQIVDGRIVGKTLLELPREQAFHGLPAHAPHPLQGTAVLISGGMGQGLVRRLAGMGIQGLVTSETEPDRAVTLFLDGHLPLMAPEAGGEHHHAHPDQAD